MQVDETKRTELAHRWTKSACSQGPGKHGQKSLLSYSLCITLASHFTYSFAVCLRQSVRGEVPWHSLCWNRGHSALLQRQPPVAHICLLPCSSTDAYLTAASWGGRNPCWKTPLVAKLTSLWCRGLRLTYSAIRQCWRKGNGDSTQLGHVNWILLFTGSL